MICWEYCFILIQNIGAKLSFVTIMRCKWMFFRFFNVIWKICTILLLKKHNMLSCHKGIVEIAPDQQAREDVSHAEPVIDMEFTNTAPHTIILTFCCILSVSGCPSTWGMSLFLGEMSSGGKVRFFQGYSLSLETKSVCRSNFGPKYCFCFKTY